MLQTEYARQRQRRLLRVLADRKLDAAVFGAAEHVYYFSTHLAHWARHAAFVLFADGRSWLCSANRPAEGAAAEERVVYEANLMSTMRSDQARALAEVVVGALRDRGATRIGVDASEATSQVMLGFEGQWAPVDAEVAQTRRIKDPDELELMRAAIRCSEAMYARAREIIEPGIEEVRVFNELHAAAVESAGEPLSALLGNDFVCGGGGGPPRRGRAAQPGELYILDVGPAYRGYFADNCRTLAVDGRVTDAQFEAWNAVVEALRIVERMARPGVRCREIVAAVDEQMTAARGQPMRHHLGHGVGLWPHEYPHLNVRWDDTLMEGEVFAAEPGAYGRELGGGLRLENQYLVTADGVENLMSYPLELA